MSDPIRIYLALPIAVVVFLVLVFGGIAQAPSIAYADDRSSTSSASVSTSTSTSESTQAADSSKDSAPDQENPLTFEIAILAGIVLVAVLFVSWIVRVNVSMRKMNDSMHSKK